MREIAEITNRVLNRCHGLGFALAGVCEARPSAFDSQYRAWIAAGKHGEMGYLARNVEMRLDPTVMVPGAKSIICVADRYPGGKSTSPQVETKKHRTSSTFLAY